MHTDFYTTELDQRNLNQRELDQNYQIDLDQTNSDQRELDQSDKIELDQTNSEQRELAQSDQIEFDQTKLDQMVDLTESVDLRIQKSLGKVILDLKAVHTLHQKTIDCVIHSFASFFNQAIQISLNVIHNLLF